MIINVSGIPGKAMGVDKNMEHNIGTVKEMFTARGLYASWDRLADISASSDLLKDVKQNVLSSLGTSYTGKTHKTPDTTDLVWRIAHKARDIRLNTNSAGRMKNEEAKGVVDVFSKGEQLLRGASLVTFNRKVKNCLAGTLDSEVDDEDVDDIPVLDIEVNVTNE